MRALPQNGLNTAVVLPHDWDQDGDLDIFAGSRSIPTNYGLPARSYLFENDGKGNFRSVAERQGACAGNPGDGYRCTVGQCPGR